MPHRGPAERRLSVAEDVTMLYPAAGTHPVIDVRKLVLSVEDVWHDGGPRNAKPLRRGSIAALLHNPYAGE